MIRRFLVAIAAVALIRTSAAAQAPAAPKDSRRSSTRSSGEPVMIRFACSPDFMIIGIGMNPASQAAEIDSIKQG